VATVRRSVTDAELQELHAAGVRGVRFNFVKRLVDFTPKDELLEIAGRIAKLGWHVVIYFEAVDLPELWDFFTALPTTVVVDHMGRPDVGLPVDGPQFALFESSCASTATCGARSAAPSACRSPARRRWTANRRLPRRGALRAPHRREFPDRVLWGTDWPHPNLKDHMPDDGLLVDFIPHIAPTPDCSRSCWWTTRCACTGPRRHDHGPGQTLPRRARHDHLRRRTVAQGLPPQPVLHEPDEGRQPRSASRPMNGPTWTSGR
jgi:2-pyrone-4,6-dicarboxylate lactonase